MSRFISLSAAALAAVAASAGGAWAESPPATYGIRPADPAAFDPVILRIPVDSCVFDPATVTIEKTDAAIEVRHRPNNCLVPGEQRAVDIRLGTYPAGRYEVHLFAQPGGDVSVTPISTYRFTVSQRPEVAVVPAPPRPIADYTGMWWNPQQGGWGLSVHQGPAGSVYATMFAYDTDGTPQWFTLLPGGWVSSTYWSAAVYRSTGPAMNGPDFDPRLVLIQPVGTAFLNFTQKPDAIGKATFEYTINGVTKIVPIERYPVR